MSGTIVLIALLLNALTVLLVLYLVYRGEKAIGDFEPYVQDVERMRGSIARRGNQILEKTIIVAQEIIRNAVTASQRNVKTSQALQAEMESTLRKGMEQNISETRSLLQKAVEDIVSGYQNQFTDLTKGIEEAGLSGRQEILDVSKQKINELSAGITQELTMVRESTQQQIDQGVRAANEKIRAYQEQKIKEVDSKIYQILIAVAKKTMGKAIDVAQHEELVMEALEKAKKEQLV
ncbi:MAG: hypothetical protein Q8O75_00995 [bacterium]|nr:hypothetical protein [bacterium]